MLLQKLTIILQWSGVYEPIYTLSIHKVLIILCPRTRIGLTGTRAGGNEGLNVEGLVKSLGGAVSSSEYEGHPVLSICVPLRPEL